MTIALTIITVITIFISGINLGMLITAIKVLKENK